ncbi:MAG: aldehyde dehydrogenase family protein [Saprospiraceae bacterium]
MNFGYKKMYIDGELVDAACGEKFDIICPANEKPIASIAWANPVDTERALVSAQKGFEFWSSLPLSERLVWIEKLRQQLIENRDHLRMSIMYEMGKVWEGTDEDLTSIIKSLKYYSDEIQSRNDIVIDDMEGNYSHKVVQQPLGVVVAFLAYNFPLLNLGFKLGPALAAGCSIIIKPSEFSPLSAYIIGELCHKIDFPKGVINVICGDVPTVGVPLCESTIPRLITMIGSTETAQKLIQQSSKTSIKRYSLECGGNAPFIVFPDADIDQAINIGAALKIGNSGQICVAANRFYIHESVIDAYCTGLVGKFKNVNIGFGKENKPDMGPLANKQSVTKTKRIINEAISQGGQLIFSTEINTEKGYYHPLTAIRLENNEAEVLQNEIFGPLALIVPFSTKEEVIALANSTDAGLASYIFSKNTDTINYFVDHLEFGEVQVNGVKYDIYLPHGGVKNSGIGVDCSIYALDDYLIKKRVSTALIQ